MLDQLVASDTAFSDIFDIVSKFSTHINMAAVEWVITMREGLRRMEQYPGSIHLVRYEDIVTNPRQALSEILRFCNLYDDEKTFSYAEQVISPVPLHPKIEIHPVLHHIFNETMGSMGY